MKKLGNKIMEVMTRGGRGRQGRSSWIEWLTILEKILHLGKCTAYYKDIPLDRDSARPNPFKKLGRTRASISAEIVKIILKYQNL